MKENSKKTLSVKAIVIILSVVVALIGLVVAGVILLKPENETKQIQGEDFKLNIDTFESREIAEGLQINYVGDYSGVFFEDGSDEIVSSILMIELENTSDKDLQLARINALTEDSVAQFEATNIPAGESVILLEKNRMKAGNKNIYDFSVDNLVFFSEKMDTMENSFSVKIADGYLELTNTGDKDTEGIIYIYYKNTVDGTLYGGITYRATINDIIKKGDVARVVTNHCTDSNTKIVEIVNVTG